MYGVVLRRRWHVDVTWLSYDQPFTPVPQVYETRTAHRLCYPSGSSHTLVPSG
jgi:hypothetical protein